MKHSKLSSKCQNMMLCSAAFIGTDFQKKCSSNLNGLPLVLLLSFCYLFLDFYVQCQIPRLDNPNDGLAVDLYRISLCQKPFCLKAKWFWNYLTSANLQKWMAIATMLGAWWGCWLSLLDIRWKCTKSSGSSESFKRDIETHTTQFLSDTKVWNTGYTI